MSAETLLSVEELNKSFGSLVVTRNVSLTVRRGERHALIGPNGAGKTSLIHQIGGQLRPSSGRILFKGVDVTGAPPETICRMGLGRTFQKNSLFPRLTAHENVRLAAQARKGGYYHPLRLARARLDERRFVDHLLGVVRMAGDPEQPASRLSYGEQRQLEIAMALAAEPELLLLDEPTSGMSPAETQRMTGLIADLPARLGVLMIEHDMDVVFSLADRISVLYYGEVIASGTPAQISADDRVREVYLGARHA